MGVLRSIGVPDCEVN